MAAPAQVGTPPLPAPFPGSHGAVLADGAFPGVCPHSLLPSLGSFSSRGDCRGSRRWPRTRSTHAFLFEAGPGLPRKETRGSPRFAGARGAAVWGGTCRRRGKVAGKVRSAASGPGKDGEGGPGKGGNSEGSPPSPSSGSGDAGVQDLLVDMIRLQTGKQEVNEFVAQKAAILSDLAKGAEEDLARIAEGANQDMDAANSRIMEAVDSQMTELERELLEARLEQAKRDQEFDEFEKQLVEKQNAGLFFKSLYQLKQKPSPTKQQVLDSNPELAKSVQKAAGSPSRRTVYGVLALLSVMTLGKAVADQAAIGSILACTAVCLALIFQVVYEFSVSQD